MSSFTSVVTVQISALVGAVALALVGAWLTWHNAPPVGGEWWPYVHVAATIVGGIIGAKIGALAGFLFGLALALLVEVVT